MKIGAIVESFKKPLAESLAEAKKIGADGVQIYAKRFTGADNPDAAVREAKKLLADNGLVLSALCGDFGCEMYYTRDRALIDREKRVMEMALEFGTNIVTTHIGVVPETKDCRQYESMHEVCRELADYAKKMNGHFAVETGPEKADRLLGFLRDLGSDGVAVNLDPANLVMCAGEDPVRAVGILKDYIVHTHAKDGLRLREEDTRRIYAPKYFDLEPVSEKCYQEVPLGKGGVDWQKYLDALRAIGFDGFLTIERECGATPADDIREAVAFLDSFHVR